MKFVAHSSPRAQHFEISVKRKPAKEKKKLHPSTAVIHYGTIQCVAASSQKTVAASRPSTGAKAAKPQIRETPLLPWASRPLPVPEPTELALKYTHPTGMNHDPIQGFSRQKSGITPLERGPFETAEEYQTMYHLMSYQIWRFQGCYPITSKSHRLTLFLELRLLDWRTCQLRSICAIL